MARGVFLLFFIVMSYSACSQFKKLSESVDATISFAGGQGSLSFHYKHLWNIGKKQKLSVGYGVRFTSYVGANQYYSTAPAELTSESTSPFILFKDNIIKNIDSLLVPTPQVNMLNASVNIHYRFSSKVVAGFNIDVIGFSFGASKPETYINGTLTNITQGRPTVFNILLVSDNDRGSLNSEFFAKYSMNRKWSFKVAAQFLFTEYTTDTKVQQYPKENDRFRNKSLMFALGVSYCIR